MTDERTWQNRITGHGEEDPEQLLAHPDQWRIHPQVQQDALSGVLDQVGWVGDVTVSTRTGHLVDGHLRTMLAMKRGEKSIPVTYVDLSENEERLILATLDPLSAMAGTDKEVLAELLAAIGEQDGAVAGLLSELGSGLDGHGEGLSDPDQIPELPKKPVTKPGDLWLLGDHRLLCGDAFNGEDRERLTGSLGVGMVLTDPPYAIYGSSTGVASDVADDKMVQPFFRSLFDAIADVLPWFAHAYVHCDWRSWAAIWEAAKRGGLTPKNCLVWDKGGGGLGANYQNAHEFVGFFAKLPAQKGMSEAKRGHSGRQRPVHRPNLLRFPRPSGADREHNAAKPVALLRQLVENSSDEGDVVLDLFGGSGSTLIAAALSGRRGFQMETEPSWCDVTVARFERVIGQKAVRE